jgi:hypothetical protein
VGLAVTVETTSILVAVANGRFVAVGVEDTKGVSLAWHAEIKKRIKKEKIIFFIE